MGCINLTMAIIDGEMKVAQYEHWHGSPDEQGAVVIKFIQDIMESPKSIKEVKAAIRNCCFASEEELIAYENGELEDSEEEFPSSSFLSPSFLFLLAAFSEYIAMR